MKKQLCSLERRNVPKIPKYRGPIVVELVVVVFFLFRLIFFSRHQLAIRVSHSFRITEIRFVITVLKKKTKRTRRTLKKKQRPNYRFDALNKKFFVFCLNGSRWRHPSRPHPRRCGETRYNSVNWKNKKGRRRRRWWWRRRRRSMRSPNGRPAGRCPPNGVVYTALVWRHYWRRRRTDSEKTKKNEGKTKKKRNQIEINFLSCLTLGVVSIALANQVGYWFFFTGFYRVLLNRIGFWRVFLGWKWVLLGFHEWNRIWFCITGFYLVLLGFIGFYWLLPGIVESNWIFEIFLGVLLGFVG